VRLARRALLPTLVITALAGLLAPACGAVGAPGTLAQLPGARGCLVGASKRPPGCGAARALLGPGPFMGSRAIAVSPDGRNVYVASSRSDAIAIFSRNPGTGALRQTPGTGGCIALKGAGGCAAAVGLDGPNSVAVSADGRNVYATSRASNAIAVFARNHATGALRQLAGAAGCVSGLSAPGCASGRALIGPDVVVLSPDGRNVYVGSFFGNAVAVFDRGPGGTLAQPAGNGGCIAEGGSGGCAAGIALGAPEGMAISRDGSSLYVASALSSALVVLARNASTGALVQASDGSGCIVDVPLNGCAAGVQLSGANAVAVSPAGRGDVYVTSLFSDSVTSFARSSSTGGLAQLPGTSACLVYLRAVGCSFGRALVAPEGLAVSPDGANAYAAAFGTGAIDVLNRARKSGAVVQKSGRAGCLAPHSAPGCSPGRALRGASSVAISPDGRNLYATAFGSNAVDAFTIRGEK
jgi:fibronectin-binding autotransporter adhesin